MGLLAAFFRRRWPKAALGFVAAGFGAFLFWRALRGHSPGELAAAVAAVPGARVLAACAFAGAAFLAHTAFDHLALIYAGARQPWRRAAFGSFCATSIGHALDLFGATSSVLRWRFWARWGVTGEQTVVALLFCGATVVLGHVTLAGLACLAAPEIAGRATHLDPDAVAWLGAACLALVAVYLAACCAGRLSIMIRGREVMAPSPAIAAAQLVAAVTDYACVAACLHQCLAAASGVGYAPTVAAYAAANAATAVTRAPGGLGVTETVVQALSPGADLIGPLLAFRAVHLVLPFLIGAVAFAAGEAANRRRTIAKATAADPR